MGRELDLNTGLQVNRNRYLHQQLGFWIIRDSLGNVDGASLYAAFFVPRGTDPDGLKVKECSCAEFVDKIFELFGNPLTIKPRNQTCNVEVRCSENCDNAPAHAGPKEGNTIPICISNNKGITEERDFWIVFEHEWQHAMDFCVTSSPEFLSCNACLHYEKRAHEVSCELSFDWATDWDRYDLCVACGVWASCSSKCDPRDIPAPKQPCNWGVLGTNIDPKIFPFPGATK